MSQRDREAVRIDISPKEKVSSSKDVKITATRWDPNKGAQAAREAAEAAVQQYVA